MITACRIGAGAVWVLKEAHIPIKRTESPRGRGGVERCGGPCGCPPCLMDGQPSSLLIPTRRPQGPLRACSHPSKDLS